jgi:hypothetical protein
MVHICYRWNLTFLANPTSTQKKLLVEYHYYILDTLFVQHCFELHWAHLTTIGIWPNKHLVWSDGYVAQFKSWLHGTMFLGKTFL